MGDVMSADQLTRPTMRADGLRIAHCMKCGDGWRYGVDLSLALVEREGGPGRLCLLCDKCLELYEQSSGCGSATVDLIEMLDADAGYLMDWLDLGTEPFESIERGRAVDIEILDGERIFWPELGYRLARCQALVCSQCGEGPQTREMYWLMSDDGDALAACLVCVGYYSQSLVSSGVVRNSVSSLVNDFPYEYADLERFLETAPDLMALRFDGWPPERIYENRVSWFEGEPVDVLTKHSVRQYVYEDIAEFEMSDFGLPAGMRMCARCRRWLGDGGFSLTRIGNGLFCPDAKDCVRRTVLDLEDCDSSRVVICERCRRNLRGLDYRVDREAGLILCESAEICERNTPRGKRRPLRDAFRMPA